MKIKITGASGYLGKLIYDELTAYEFDVSGIERKLLYGNVKDLMNEIKETDVIINLAGAPIFQRWTEKNKKIIYKSRIITTRNLVTAINELPPDKQPAKFISSSAKDIYQANKEHDETSSLFNTGFLGKIVMEWENELEKLNPEIQKYILRIGLVLGEKAKMIKSLLLPYRLGLGAKFGSGNQPFPFIHEKDVTRAFLWIINENPKNGIYNLVAPEKITNKDFTQKFAKKLNRPALFKIPGFILDIIFGKASVMLKESPQINSEKITNAGFHFLYPNLNRVLDEIIKKRG